MTTPVRSRVAPSLIFVLLLGSAFASGCKESTSHATPDAGPADPLERPQRFLTDELGRARIFHGFNIENRSKGSAQSDPHQPRIDEVELGIARNEWGMSLSRHLIFWGAVEPAMGVYDEAYLDQVEAHLDAYEAAGVKVLLDMHQDLYAWMLTGNGFPDWAVMTVNQDVVTPTTPWSLAYFHPRVKEAFDNFWSYAGPYRVLQDHYAAAWVRVAQRFGDHPAVIGYDLMNEPHPGSDFDFFEGGTPQFEAGTSYVFDREKLGPFYQRIIDAIRTVDSDTWIFYEPRYGFPGDGAPSYLPTLNDPREGEDRLVQAPHLYSIAYEIDGAYDPSTDRTFSRWEAERDTDMREHDTPLFLGEWGHDQTFVGATVFTEQLLAMSDRMMIGWTYWSWDSDGTWSAFDRTGDPQDPFVERPLMDQLVRPYPMAIAGKPIDYSYDPDSRVFRLVFDDVPGVTDTAPSLVFLPNDRIYPNGYYVSLSDAYPPSNALVFDATTHTLAITVDTALADRHVVIIGPLSP